MVFLSFKHVFFVRQGDLSYARRFISYNRIYMHTKVSKRESERFRRQLPWRSNICMCKRRKNARCSLLLFPRFLFVSFFLLGWLFRPLFSCTHEQVYFLLHHNILCIPYNKGNNSSVLERVTSTGELVIDKLLLHISDDREK